MSVSTLVPEVMAVEGAGVVAVEEGAGVGAVEAGAAMAGHSHSLAAMSPRMLNPACRDSFCCRRHPVSRQ